MRRALATAALALALVIGASGVAAPDGETGMTIDALQKRMASGELTARALTETYLRRIADIDRAGPALRAVIETNPDALAIADALDAERKAGRVRGPLHGIPVLLKDNVGTADRMETTAGSLALVGARPSRDAPLVARLRDAGAVVLGKTNLSEWANFRSSKSTSGWSARGGQTRNPHALDRNPSGSSSGSAAAVAADLCVVAVGTETDGSIVSPASACGVVGVKPTVGLVSRTGIVPISASQDTAGPMARTVRDAAILLEAMAGADPADPAASARPAGLATDYAARLAPLALKGARIGVLRGPFGFDERFDPLFAKCVEALRAGGAEIVEVGEFPDLAKLGDPEMEVLLYEFKSGLDAYLASLGPASRVKSLADVVKFDEQNAALEMPIFGQDLFVRALAKGPLTDKAYVDARALCVKIARTDGIDGLTAKHRLDALVALTGGPAWMTDHVNGDSFGGYSGSPAAVAGCPSVTVPAGDLRGLPVGLSFFGRAWTEAKLLALAADFEGRTQARRAPRFLATVNEMK